MNKLTIEHLSCYLPYGLKVKLEFKPDTEIPWYYEDTEVFTMEGMMLDWYGNDITEIKPYLRQLSDLTREIEHNGERFVPRHKFIGNPLDYKILHNSYSVVQQLLKWHFDVFGLIDKGLALNINEHEDKAGNR